MDKPVTGDGWLTKALSLIPAELHIPGGYNFCGPNTKLKERLARGDKGINPLDDACLDHDNVYDSTEDSRILKTADDVLAVKAWDRFKSKATPLKEKAAAMLVVNAMKLKRKLGGARRLKSNSKSTLSSTVSAARKAVKNSKTTDIKQAAKIALKAAKRATKNNKSADKIARVLPIPKRGGVLPFLVPLFAGLSAAGGIAGGAAAIAKAVNDTAAARKSLIERKRHNQKMEAIALQGKTYGRGFYLRPYKNGYGLMTKSKN